MVSSYVVERVAREISGDVVWSANPGEALRKWREAFGVSQSEVARRMGVAPSVINDYERGRRTPGSGFVKKYVSCLIEIDRERGWRVLEILARSSRLLLPEAVIDMREFTKPVTLSEVVEVVDGEVLWGAMHLEKRLYGYTVVDSIGAITTMSGNEFYSLMGLTTERVLVFTRVGTGRSPMVAVRVSPLKPGAVVVHGPKIVDKLAVLLAEKDNVPLVLSHKSGVEELVSSLRSLASGF